MENLSINREIDLMPIIIGVLRRWYWIVVASILGGVVASAAALLTPTYYEATAGVIFLGNRSNVTLDSRIVTQDSRISNYISRRQALVQLATSNVIETQLPAEVVQELAPSEYKVGQFAGSISAVEEGDLLWITVDSSEAEEAQRLANEWAVAYVSYINNLLSKSNSSAITVSEQQIVEAQATYEQAQKQYVEYIAQQRMDKLNDEINSLYNLLDGNRKLNVALYESQRIRANTLSLVLQDAQALRNQISNGSTIVASENLAVLLLRVRAVAPEPHANIESNTNDTSGTIINQSELEVHLADSITIDANKTEILADLDRLIALLEEQLAILSTTLTESVNAITNNKPLEQGNWTVKEQQEQYENLAELRAQREEIEGQREVLKQTRQVALEKLEVVERQLAEQQVLATQNNNEVRLASSALLPTSPASRGITSRFVIGTITGMVFGTFLAFLAAIQLPAMLRRVSKQQSIANSDS